MRKKGGTPPLFTGMSHTLRRYAISIDDVLMWWRRRESNPRPKALLRNLLRAQTVILGEALFPSAGASRQAIRLG